MFNLSDVTISKVRIHKSVKHHEMDACVKLILCIVLMMMPFLFQKPVSLALLTIYLFVLTLFSKIKPRILLKSMISYAMVFLIPYLFGILMSSFLFLITGNEFFFFQQKPYETFLRLYELFIIWYVSILYFHTTPVKIMMGLFDKLFTPLKIIGVPVSGFLKVIMCVVTELTEMGTDILKNLGESIRTATRQSGKKFKLNIQEIAQIIVSLIISSFDHLDRIESMLDGLTDVDLKEYKFRFSATEGMSMLSFVLLVILVLMIENHFLI